MAFVLKTDQFINLDYVLDQLDQRGMRSLVRQLQRRAGVLVRDASPKEAGLLTRLFKERKVPVVNMPSSELLHIPKSRYVRNATLYTEAIKLALRGSKEVVEKTWDRVFLCVCGVIIPTSGSSEIEAGKNGDAVFRRDVQRLVSGTPRVVLDIFFESPYERFRLQKEVPNFGRESGDSDAFRRLGTELYNFAADEAMNPGVEVLAKHGFGGDWKNVTFSDPEEFDGYCLWLLQIRKYELNAVGSKNRGHFIVPALGKPNIYLGQRHSVSERHAVISLAASGSTHRRRRHSRRYERDTISEIVGKEAKQNLTGWIIFILIIIFIIIGILSG
jgi:hypothetical protein